MAEPAAPRPADDRRADDAGFYRDFAEMAARVIAEFEQWRRERDGLAS